MLKQIRLNLKPKAQIVLKFTLLFTLILGSSSCLNQGETPKIPGVDGPKVNIIDGKVLLSVGLENINLPVALTLPIPKTKESATHQ